MTLARLRLLVLALLVLAASPALADVFRPAYLELKELGDGRYDVLWKVPAREDAALALSVVFPSDTQVEGEPRAVFTGDALVKRWRVRRAGGLVGQTVRLQGKAVGSADVIARVERTDGTAQVERLSPERPELVVAASKGIGAIAGSYLVLGVEHILGGLDHLLFVLSLLLLVRGAKRIVTTVTAFTVAHSLTLVAATAGWVHAPGPPVEAVIALSIAFMAAEIVHSRRGRQGLTARAPWAVAFSFGLLHGFGFAGALAELGLPEKSIPLALLAFNVGVELGQLAFVAAMLLLGALYRRFGSRLSRLTDPALPYAIGSVALFWVFERAASFWQ
jgi:hydrogenase/urease accessory protein HupE